MTLKTVALGLAGVGAAAAFGLLKWKVLTGNGKWWALGAGALLFVLSGTAIADAPNNGTQQRNSGL